MNNLFSNVSYMLFPWILLWTLFRNSVAAEDVNKGEGYNFHYQVDSESDNVHFGHNEDRRGYHTIGSYKTLLPDGRTQVVEYKVVDKDSGYVAKVYYQGVARGANLPFKGIKREIPAGPFLHPVNKKPYGRDIKRHIQQAKDIYTTMIPSAIKNFTVIPSPELVTVATLFDLNTDTSSEERQQESNSTTSLFRSIKSDHLIHSPVIDDKRFTESSKTEQHTLFTTAVTKRTETVKVIPLPETVTAAMELTGNKFISDGHNSSLVPESEEIHQQQKNITSASIKKVGIITQQVNNLSTINNQSFENDSYNFQKQLKNDRNVPKGAEPFEMLHLPANVNISINKPNKHKSSYTGINHIYNKAQPMLEYNFKPTQVKTTFTKADDTMDTKNKALYQTNFTPKSYRLYALQKPVKNYYRKSNYLLQNKKHDKHYIPIHFPLISNTRRTDGFPPPKKKNPIKIQNFLKNPILSFKDWFPPKL